MKKIRKKLNGLKSVGLLSGARGEAKGDIDAFVDAILRVSHLVTKFPQIRELDLNPVRVMPGKGGTIALDARIRVAVDG
ncbi:MAG: hypothetical protein GXP53_01640 [Deltaproteobacteria bacterium]|nr:hypothetical protein [Deltaproteobacteria bacterium]